MPIVVVGNGILGSLSAIELAKLNPSEEIFLIGKKSRPHSASKAAGAMIAVFAEYDLKTGTAKTVQDIIFDLSLESRNLWIKFISDNKLHHAVSSKSTLVYLKKNPCEFEIENFESVRSKVKGSGFYSEADSIILEDLFPVGISHLEDGFIIDGEFSIDVIKLFDFFDSEIAKYKVNIVDQEVSEINLQSNQVRLKNDEVLIYSKLILSAGAKTSNLLKPNCILPIYSAVGSAIVFQSDKFSKFNKDFVIRSVNRGGAQCGIHFLPKSDGFFYLGAGSYISNEVLPMHRIETLRYLFQTFIDDIAGREIAYESKGEIVIGNRPKSLDGLPLLGPLKEFNNVFVLSGNNRVGLTLAPKLIQILTEWATKNVLDKRISMFAPDRVATSLNSLAESVSYLVKSRIGNAIEHEMLLNNEHSLSLKTQEIKSYVANLVKTIENKHPNLDLSTIDPDNWSLLS